MLSRIDNRRAITIDQYPFSSIGLLQVDFNNNLAFGTAVLVAYNIAITSAHNIFSRSGLKLTQLAFLNLGMTGQKLITYQVIYAFIPKQYRQLQSDSKAKNFNFAVLILNNNKPFGQTFGFIPVKPFTQDIKEVHVYGFPLDKNQQKNRADGLQEIRIIRTMFGCSDQLVKFDDNLIFHKVDSGLGLSGAPILAQKKNTKKYEVIGIHTGRFEDLKFGVRMTKDLIERMSKWIVNLQEPCEQKIQLCSQSIINSEQTYNLMVSTWKNTIKNSQIKEKYQKIHQIQPVISQQSIFKLNVSQGFKPVRNVNKSEIKANLFIDAVPMQQYPINKFQIDNRKIFKKLDEKTRRYDYPFCAIGRLFLKFNNFTAIGTAFIVGDSLVMTCAHNVFHKGRKIQAQSITFYPSLHENEGIGFHVKKIFYPEQFKNCQPEKKIFHQFALLYLGSDVNLTPEYGRLGLNFSEFSQVNFQQNKIMIYGYDTDDFLKGTQDYYHSVRFKGQIFYELFTKSGQSGSPIMMKISDDNYQVIGIHVSKERMNNLSTGVKLSEYVRSTAQKWVHFIHSKQKQSYTPGKSFI